MALFSSAFSGRQKISELNTEIRKKTVEIFSVLSKNRGFANEANPSVPVNDEELRVFGYH